MEIEDITIISQHREFCFCVLCDIYCPFIPRIYEGSGKTSRFFRTGKRIASPLSALTFPHIHISSSHSRVHLNRSNTAMCCLLLFGVVVVGCFLYHDIITPVMVVLFTT